MPFRVSLLSFTMGYILGLTASKNTALLNQNKVNFKKNTSSTCMTFAFDDTSQASSTITHEASALLLGLSLYTLVSAFRRTIYLLHLFTHIAVLAGKSCWTNQRL